MAVGFQGKRDLAQAVEAHTWQGGLRGWPLVEVLQDGANHAAHFELPNRRGDWRVTKAGGFRVHGIQPAHTNTSPRRRICGIYRVNRFIEFADAKAKLLRGLYADKFGKSVDTPFQVHGARLGIQWPKREIALNFFRRRTGAREAVFLPKPAGFVHAIAPDRAKGTRHKFSLLWLYFLYFALFTCFCAILPSFLICG